MLKHKRKGRSDARWGIALRQELEAIYLQYYLVGRLDRSLLRNLWKASEDLGWSEKKFNRYKTNASRKAQIIAKRERLAKLGQGNN